MAERIARLAALVDRTRALRAMRGREYRRERKLKKELPKPSLILAAVAIDLAVRALEIRIAHGGRAAVPGGPETQIMSRSYCVITPFKCT
jgi:hypothetical protein